MSLKGKKVLITGGAGFVGGHVCESLLKQGAKLFCVTRHLNSQSYFFKTGLNKRSILLKCDLSNEQEVKKLFKKNNFDFIFHLAGVLRPKNLQEGFFGNVSPTINLLEGAKTQKKLKAFIFASTTRAKIQYLRGKNLDKLISRPYDLSKTISEVVVKSYVKNYKLPVVIIKYPNVFGPGDSLVRPLRLTAEIMLSLKNHQAFQSKADPSTRVDFVFVKEVAKAFVSTANNFERFKYRTIELKPSARFSIGDWEKKIASTINQGKPKTILEKAIAETFNWV